MSQTQQTPLPSSEATQALDKSILAPRDGEDHPYLMPVATASHCATLDASGDGLYLSYPRRVIWVDFDNGSDGNDGSQAAPLKTLSRVFSDKLLACVCQHIGQDRIPVCCKGTYTHEESITLNASGKEEDKITSNGSSCTMFGSTADYCRHLEIMPWPNEARPVFKIKYTATMPNKENVKARLMARMTIAKQTHGIYWNKCDFVFEIDVTYKSDKQILRIDTELYGFDRCEHIATIDCNMQVIVNRYNARTYATFTPDETSTGGSGGGGGGSGGHGSGSGWHSTRPLGYGRSHNYDKRVTGGEDTSREEDTVGETVNCYLGIMHYRQCNNAFVAGGAATWQAEARSNYTAQIYSSAFEHCENLHARNYTLNALSVATAEGAGEEWTSSDGSHGIKTFKLEPTATTRITSGCANAILHNVTGNITAKAYAKAKNTPYTTTADSVTTYHEIDGESVATAIAYSQADKIDDGDEASIHADATHPNNNITMTTAQKG